jgi:hypothetical protein
VRSKPTSGGPDLRDCIAQASICISRSVKAGPEPERAEAPASLPESDIVEVGLRELLAVDVERRGKKERRLDEDSEDVVGKKRRCQGGGGDALYAVRARCCPGEGECGRMLCNGVSCDTRSTSPGRRNEMELIVRVNISARLGTLYSVPYDVESGRSAQVLKALHAEKRAVASRVSKLASPRISTRHASYMADEERDPQGDERASATGLYVACGDDTVRLWRCTIVFLLSYQLEYPHW